MYPLADLSQILIWGLGRTKGMFLARTKNSGLNGLTFIAKNCRQKLGMQASMYVFIETDYSTATFSVCISLALKSLFTFFIYYFLAIIAIDILRKIWGYYSETLNNEYIRRIYQMSSVQFFNGCFTILRKFQYLLK